MASQRFSMPCPADALDVYRALRAGNPSPYMYLFRFTRPDGTAYDVVGSSPEALVKVTGTQAITHPIAGSRPRGKSPEDDVRLAEDLLADADARDEGLHVVGAVVLDEVLRDAEAAVGRQLLQGGLPVEAGAHGRGGLHHRVEEPVDHVGRDLEAAAEVDGTEHRFDGVGEDRGLVAPAGRLLAPAELDVVAQTDLATDLGQCAGVDDGGP